jgi:hypothetical protein
LRNISRLSTLCQSSSSLKKIDVLKDHLKRFFTQCSILSLEFVNLRCQILQQLNCVS